MRPLFFCYGHQKKWPQANARIPKNPTSPVADVLLCAWLAFALNRLRA
jgi:hypothetical protein